MDAIAPDTLLSTATYDAANNKIILTASTTDRTFSELGLATDTDIKSYLDWSKFSMIIDEQASSPTSVTFNASGKTTADSGKVTSAKLSNNNTLNIQLDTTYANDTLEALAGFGLLGGASFEKGSDAIKIYEGFIKDKVGNSADLDDDKTVDTTNDYVIFSSVSEPSTKAIEASGTTAAIPVAYPTSEVAPQVKAFLAAASSDTGLSLNDRIQITAITDKSVTKGSKFTAILDVTDNDATATDPTVTFEALADGNKLVAMDPVDGNQGYKIKAGENIATGLKVISYKAGTTTLDGQYTGGGLSTTGLTVSGGNITPNASFNVTGVSTGSLAGTLKITGITNSDYAENKTFVVDAIASSIKITQVNYKPSEDKIILKGSNFNTIGANAGVDFKSVLGQNSKVMKWDTGGTGAADDIVSIGASNIKSAKINGETIEIVLDSTFASNSLEKLSAKPKYAGSTEDKLLIEAGFFSDTNGNVGAESLSYTKINFSDTTGPTITDISTSGTTGQTYNSSSSPLTVTVTFNEDIASGSSIALTLNSGGTVTASTAVGTNALSGNYTIGGVHKTNKLDVDKVTSSSVKDIYTNDFVVGDGSVSGSVNISSDQTILISNIKNADVLTDTVTENVYDNGDVLIFRLTKAPTGSDKTKFETDVKAVFGSGATLAWYQSDTQLNVTIDSLDTSPSYATLNNLNLSVTLSIGSDQEPVFSFDI